MLPNVSRRAWLAGAGAATALAGGRSVVRAQAGRDKVVVGALRFTSHAAGFIALDRGYFEHEGIDASFSFFQAAQPIAVAVASGDADFGVAGITGGLMNLARKDAIRVAGGVLQEKPGLDGMMILASNKAHASGLDDVSKIRGRSVAISQVGSTFHYALSRIARKANFEVSSVRLLPLQSVGAMVAALKSGIADVMIMVPDIAKPIVEAGDAKQLGWLYDYANYQVSTLFTNVGNIKGRRPLVERFVRAYGRGVADYDRAMVLNASDAAEREAITRIVAKYVAPDRPFEAAQSFIVAGSMYLNEGTALNKTDIAEQLQWFQQERLIDFDLSMDRLVDDSFVRSF